MAQFEIEKFIQKEIQKFLPAHLISEAYQYAMFPAGKLFRPNLALAIYRDLNPEQYEQAINLKNKDILYFASALECHHSYSLVHDDLPSMDNDDFRRGKESTHKKFGEWKAILIGDGLLNISYEFLTKIKNSDPHRHLLLMKIFARSMGPKGLIHGQTLDLSHEMTYSFANTLLTHKFKTGRLIQMASIGACLLATTKDLKREKLIWKFSENIGILFQLLDDLSELNDAKLSAHELDVNPWLKFPEETYHETLKRLESYLNLYSKLKLTYTHEMLKNYFKKMNDGLKEHQSTVVTHLQKNVQLIPVMNLLDRIDSTH